MKRINFSIVLSILILSILVGSCSGHQHERGEALSQRDTVYVHIEKVDSVIMRDTITMPPETIVTYRVSNYIHPGPIKLDSIETQEIMEASLVKGRIELPLINDRYPDELFYRKDLEYMPYMMLTLSKPYSLRDNGANTCLNKMVNICYHSIYDDRLKELGKRYIDSHNELIDLEPPIMNPRGKVVDRHWRYHEQFETRKITSVDSLRIKALIHNDRDALTKLEEHYREIGYELGVAIYYKVMLGFEGNGDLAERFYRVVEPHFVKNALLKQAAQEVLTLAAIRDRNERARELCDSLGYRLYEYEPDKKFNNQ